MSAREHYAILDRIRQHIEDGRYDDAQVLIDRMRDVYEGKLGMKEEIHLHTFQKMIRDYTQQNRKARARKKPLIDAKAMHKKHPKTFEVPTAKALKGVKADNFVKVAARVGGKDNPESERFWVKVTGRKGGDIEGVIDNVLMYGDVHGHRYGDKVKIKTKQVYSILNPRQLPGFTAANPGPISLNAYLGDAIERARCRQEREAWERGGRRGPPPCPPKRARPEPERFEHYGEPAALRNRRKNMGRRRNTEVVSIGPRGTACALPGPLKSEERYALPDWAFALPGDGPRSSRKYPLYVLGPAGAVVPSKTHAMNAKGRAKQQLERGTLSRADYNQIVRMADEVIKKCKAAPTTAREVAEMGIAANPHSHVTPAIVEEFRGYLRETLPGPASTRSEIKAAATQFAEDHPALREAASDRRDIDVWAEELTVVVVPKRNPPDGEIKIDRKGYCVKKSKKRKGYCVKPTTYYIKDRGRPGKRSYGAEGGTHPASEGYEPFIRHEGTLGKGFLKTMTNKQREAAIDRCVKKYDYRTCLGKILVFNLSGPLRRKYGKQITQAKDYIVKKYGGPGSFGKKNGKKKAKVIALAKKRAAAYEERLQRVAANPHGEDLPHLYELRQTLSEELIEPAANDKQALEAELHWVEQQIQKLEPAARRREPGRRRKRAARAARFRNPHEELKKSLMR